MAKYISSIRDLVIQAMTNVSEIEAKSNDAGACFQMGMMYLLGINTSIDFKKASSYFSNQSLAGNPEVNRLLGFIAECEGDYSEAFKCYAKSKDTTGKDKNLPLYNKVFEERNHLQKFFKEMGLPSIVLNTEVSAILGDYVKGGKSKVEACLKIATICNDESSCLEAAQTLYDRKDFYSAQKWLQKGNIASDNSLYGAINDKLAKSKKGLTLSNTLEVIDIQGTSLLPDNHASNGITDIKHRCDDVAQSSKKQWVKEVASLISKIKNELKEEEKRLKKQKEEEEKRKRQAEYQAYLREQEEEEERRRKRKKILKYVAVFIAINCVILCGSMGGDSQDESLNSPDSVMVSDTEKNKNVSYAGSSKEKVDDEYKEEDHTSESTADIESESEQSMSATKIEFKGYINNKYEIVAILNQDGTRLQGRYYYVQTMLKNGDKPSTYISLTGTIDNNGNANLIGRTIDGTEENWQGKFESDNYGITSFRGTFKGTNGKEFEISMETSN